VSLELRPYQVDLFERARAALREVRRLIMVAPTGAGKTVIAAHMAEGIVRRRLSAWFLVHRRELLNQTSEAFDELGIPHRLIASGEDEKPGEGVQIAMISTLVRRLDRHAPPRLIVVDEAHHARAASYEQVLAHGDGALVIGLTATPQRLDGRGLGAHFERIVEGPAVRALIKDGWLADYDYYAPPLQFDLRGVHKLAGDYNSAELEARVATRKVIGDVVDHYRRVLQGRPSIGFCVSLRHATEVEALFGAEGFRAATIDGTMSWDERRRRLRALGSGEFNLLLSCELIGEGVVVPTCYGIVDMRPTASLTIFLQHIGRGLRRKPDGGKAIILDHVGNCERHGLPDAPRTWTLADKPRKETEPPGYRQCPRCYLIVEPRRRPDCGDGDCPLAHPPEERGRTIEHVEGRLEQIEVGDLRWAKGIDIATAAGPSYARLLRLAGIDPAKLAQIARIRGFKPAWARYQLLRQRGRRT
jgi:superfamily II DNA or RNA helicase